MRTIFSKLKTCFSLSLILLLSANSFAQSSKIITTKKEAIKLGIYQPPSQVDEQKKPIVLDKKTKKELAKKIKIAKAQLNEKNEKDIIIDDNPISYLAEQLVNNAFDNLGVNYTYGGTSKNGYDCSGLMCTIYKKFDVDLPRISSQMADVGEKISVNKAAVGDLIFFATMGGSRISHVGMITEVNGDEIKFIHSSTSQGVIVSSIVETYYQNTFVQINRIL